MVLMKLDAAKPIIKSSALMRKFSVAASAFLTAELRQDSYIKQDAVKPVVTTDGAQGPYA
ncbi:hypothetical protein J2T57_004463 [Natronocella acetinitrilica]|uniref:Uncharacterized protein n=2 Tax=Natronocella acetinitrilica TaxID=414046 RepID=A0AAE3KDW6_9GAMM|nr:hypothetical protein [Natronocella acetinitrilica]